jgi:hypothetical protein
MGRWTQRGASQVAIVMSGSWPFEDKGSENRKSDPERSGEWEKRTTPRNRVEDKHGWLTDGGVCERPQHIK